MELTITEAQKTLIIDFVNNLVIDCIGNDFIDKYLNVDVIKEDNSIYVNDVIIPKILALIPKYQKCIYNNPDDKECTDLEFADFVYDSDFPREFENIPIRENEKVEL